MFKFLLRCESSTVNYCRFKNDNIQDDELYYYITRSVNAHLYLFVFSLKKIKYLDYYNYHESSKVVSYTLKVWERVIDSLYN